MLPTRLCSAPFTLEGPARTFERRESVVRACDNVLASHHRGEPHDPLGDQLRVLDDAGSTEIHPTIAWAKLKSLADGARLATKQLWGHG